MPFVICFCFFALQTFASLGAGAIPQILPPSPPVQILSWSAPQQMLAGLKNLDGLQLLTDAATVSTGRGGYPKSSRTPDAHVCGGGARFKTAALHGGCINAATGDV